MYFKKIPELQKSHIQSHQYLPLLGLSLLGLTTVPYISSVLAAGQTAGVEDFEGN